MPRCQGEKRPMLTATQSRGPTLTSRSRTIFMSRTQLVLTARLQRRPVSRQQKTLVEYQRERRPSRPQMSQVLAKQSTHGGLMVPARDESRAVAQREDEHSLAVWLRGKN